MADPLDPLLASETRAVATSPEVQRRFRRYWRRARFGIHSIRWLLLPAIRRRTVAPAAMRVFQRVAFKMR